MYEYIVRKVEYLGKSIILQTNDMMMFYNLKRLYGSYIRFEKCSATELVGRMYFFKILKDRKMYNKYLKKLLHKTKLNQKDLSVSIRRDNVIIVDRMKKELCVIYDEYADEKLKHIEEILFGIYGRMLENDGYVFFHGICLAKEKKAIIIFPDDSYMEQILICLLQHSFDFVSYRSFGIKNQKCIAIPSRVKIDLKKCNINGIENRYIEKMRETETYFYEIGYKDFLNNRIKEIFNMTIYDLQKIYNVKAFSEIEIEKILNFQNFPGYREDTVEKMSKMELYNKLTENRIDGFCNSLAYLKQLIPEMVYKVPLDDVINVQKVSKIELIKSDFENTKMIDYVNKIITKI